MIAIRQLLLAVLAGLMLAGPGAADPLAKTVFGAQKLPAAAPSRVFGFYSKGCFQGGVAIAVDGPHWQAMRLSRNRRWGHPRLVGVLERLSRDGAKAGWNGLMIGDISQPRGGPMLSGHASHQLGLDADIWFTPMPDRRLTKAERESVSAVSMLKGDGLYVDDRLWTPAHEAILRTAALYPEVERILVHPGIKKKLCDTVRGDRSWLRKVRPFWGHNYHFHVRVSCPPDSPDCRGQEATPKGDGCDKSLAWWFTDEPWRKAEGPEKPKARDTMRLSALPRACAAVLAEPSPPSEAAVTVTGKEDPAAVAAAVVPAAGTAAPAPAEVEAAPVSAFAAAPRDAPLPTPRPVP